MASTVLISVNVQGRLIDVVEQRGDGECYLDLFEQSTGECLNLGEPIFEPLGQDFDKWPNTVKALVEDFLLENAEV